MMLAIGKRLTLRLALLALTLADEVAGPLDLADASRRLDVVLILAADLGVGELGVSGQRVSRTTRSALASGALH